LIKLFTAKGVDARELAALIWAHTALRSFAEQEIGSIPWGSELSRYSYQPVGIEKYTKAFSQRLKTPRPDFGTIGIIPKW
jgi:hypothetical protein